jgi:hypothetical protein
MSVPQQQVLLGAFEYQTVTSRSSRTVEASTYGAAPAGSRVLLFAAQARAKAIQADQLGRRRPRAGTARHRPGSAFIVIR